MFSHKDFTGQTLIDRSPKEFEGITIKGSCFSQELPDTKVFPDGIKKITFDSCNLDNVLLPEGAILVSSIYSDGLEICTCSTKRFMVQDDGEDWLVDEENNPIEPSGYSFLMAKSEELKVKNPEVSQRLEEICVDKISKGVDIGIIDVKKVDSKIAFKVDIAVAEIVSERIAFEDKLIEELAIDREVV